MRAFFCHSRACLAHEEFRFFARSRMKIDSLWVKGRDQTRPSARLQSEKAESHTKLLFREIMQLNTRQAIVEIKPGAGE